MWNKTGYKALVIWRKSTKAHIQHCDEQNLARGFRLEHCKTL